MEYFAGALLTALTSHVLLTCVRVESCPSPRVDGGGGGYGRRALPTAHVRLVFRFLLSRLTCAIHAHATCMRRDDY